MYIILFLSATVLFALAWIFRRFLFNAWYILCVITNALKDFGCQLFIDVSRIWKGKKYLDRKKPGFDERDIYRDPKIKKFISK